MGIKPAARRLRHHQLRTIALACRNSCHGCGPRCPWCRGPCTRCVGSLASAPVHPAHTPQRALSHALRRALGPARCPRSHHLEPRTPPQACSCSRVGRFCFWSPRRRPLPWHYFEGSHGQQMISSTDTSACIPKR